MKQEIINNINLLAKEGAPFLFVINYDGDDAYIRRLKDIEPEECLYDFEGMSNAGNTAIDRHALPSAIRWDINAPTYESYERSFNIVKGNMLAGNSYLANLTCKVHVSCNLTLEDIFHHSKGKYKLLLRGDENRGRRFVCFSPESFLRIKDGRIYSYPMKGTIDASLPNARQELMDEGGCRARNNRRPHTQRPEPCGLRSKGRPLPLYRNTAHQ